MIYITAIPNAFLENEIFIFGLGRSHNNHADAFKNFKHCPSMEMILHENHCLFPIEQSVYRLNKQSISRDVKKGTINVRITVYFESFQN